ncbi:hypothetical protein [Mesorhizobium sp. M0578]|uniref:hypothetical protein n=1 Tax=unclassified Mesorhizobium TaxID=325217 RepID=UPI00333CE908
MDTAEWRTRIGLIIEKLRSLTRAEFFDEQNGLYNDVEQDLFALYNAFTFDMRWLKPFLEKKRTGRARWLPLDPNDLASMDVREVYWRLQENHADDRFMDGALIEPFENGSLVAALERISEGLDGLVPQRN